MSFTIYFALVALANIFLGYFLAMKLGLVVPAVSGGAKAGKGDSDWDEEEDDSKADKK